MENSSIKPKGDEVLNHSVSFVSGFTFSPEEFYGMIVNELAARKIPGLTVSQVEYAEGGMLSSNRVYLRMIRERLAFDACAAPFGDEFFFSCRTIYSPVKVRLWHLLVLFNVLCGVHWLLIKPLGIAYGTVAFGWLLVALCSVFHNTSAFGLADLDAFLLKVPIISPIYEKWFRKETYYRKDTRLLYMDAIQRLFADLVDEVTAAKGIKLVRSYDVAPILGPLYTPRPPKAEPLP